MAYVCFNCGKGSNYGTQHRHRPGVAGRQHYRKVTRTPKIFRPNLQSAYLIVDGSSQRVKLCTKCRRLLKKEGLIAVWTKQDVENKEVKIQPKKVKETKTIVKESPVIKETKVEKKEEKKVIKETDKKPKNKTTEDVKTPKISVEDLVGKKK